jgi:hypothetical protein
MYVTISCFRRSPNEVLFGTSNLEVSLYFIVFLFQNLGKGKVIPLQAWTGPEGFRR